MLEIICVVDDERRDLEELLQEEGAENDLRFRSTPVYGAICQYLTRANLVWNHVVVQQQERIRVLRKKGIPAAIAAVRPPAVLGYSGSISQAPPGTVGFKGKPVVFCVAQGI